MHFGHAGFTGSTGGTGVSGFTGATGFTGADADSLLTPALEAYHSSKPASRREISVVLAFIVSARYRHFYRRKPVCALQVSLEAPALRASLEPLASLEAQVGVQAILHINESSSLSFSFRKLTTFVS